MPFDDRTRELIALGAAVAANNPPEVKHHVARAREFGAADQELSDAVEIGRQVRQGAASKTDLFARSIAVIPVEQEGGCRRGGGKGRGHGHGGDHGHGQGNGSGQGDGCGCKE